MEINRGGGEVEIISVDDKLELKNVCVAYCLIVEAQDKTMCTVTVHYLIQKRFFMLI